MKATTATPNATSHSPRRRKPAAKFLYDEKGRKSHVLLDIKLYEQLLYEIEMAEDVQAYRAAKVLNEPTISWEELKRQIDAAPQTGTSTTDIDVLD